MPEVVDLDYFGVLYAREGTVNQINIADSIFRQGIPNTGSVPINNSGYLPKMLESISGEQRFTVQNIPGHIYIAGARAVNFIRNTITGNMYLRRGAFQIVNTTSFSD